MKDRLRSFPELRVFCQNVNRNYGYMDTLLASLYEQYDLLFIQEPPWRRIRSAPSATSRDGEDVIGPPISPNWGVIHRPSSLEEPPRVLVYFNTRIAALRPAYRRDLIDHRDVILFSLGLGVGSAYLRMSTQTRNTPRSGSCTKILSPCQDSTSCVGTSTLGMPRGTQPVPRYACTPTA